MSPDLLVTKLYIPLAHQNLVPRMRLHQRLDEARRQHKKLILVSASAGYGKTTLVTDWLGTLEANSTWLSLDQADNDPARFLAYLIATLQTIDRGIGKNAQALLQSPQPLPVEVVLTTLVNEIAAVPTAFILVLDDYHVIEAMPVHQQLDFLVGHLPPKMQMVIITREDPPLPLARLRARAQMAEIRQDDLRFSVEECADFLQRVMALNLSSDDINALERRTEGWIAGLQLAAISMRGCNDLNGFIEAFSGSSHYVLDYLMEEVFEREPIEEQDFLLKTSILDRLCGPLCDTVTGRTGSAVLLDRLEHANLFTISLDQSRTWYRYHHLFAGLIRQRLQSSEAYSENELHRRASQWFASEGYTSEAIQHALAASDWDGAAGLIGAHSATMLRQGELVTLLGWLNSLPEEFVRANPQLCRDYGWALTLTGQFDRAAPYLECAERAVQTDAAQLGQVLVAQAYLARTRGDYTRSIALSKQALALIHPADVLHRSLVTFTLGLAYFRSGDLVGAEQALLEACQAARLSENDYARLTALSFLGAIQMMQGKLHRAAEYSQQALQEAQGSPTAAQAQVFQGAILYEWNDLGAAAEHLEQGLKASQYIGNRMIQADAYCALARLKQAKGDSSSALEILRELRQIAYESEAPVLRINAAACHVEIALAQGATASASHWAEQLTTGIETAALGPPYALTQARLLLAQGKRVVAEETLADIYQQVSRAGLQSRMIETRALQALAAHAPADALSLLMDALRLAKPEGFIRTFADHGEPMRALLDRLKSQSGELKDYILTILAAFGETGRAILSQPLIEPLSERELEVLQLLDRGMTNVEIAQRLIISVGTVKTHVHSIIEKLGVRSRAQAVNLARQLDLL